MQIDNLSWFPGHMTKTKRMISAEIKNMDAVCEIVDARIPLSSRNPDVDELTAGKPRLIVLNRADQADPPLDPVFPRPGLRRAGGQRQKRCGYREIFRRRPRAAAG